MFESTVRKLEKCMNEEQYTEFLDKRGNIIAEHKHKKRSANAGSLPTLYDTLYKKLILPYVRQYGMKVELKSIDRIVDIIGNPFRLDSDLAKVLMKDMKCSEDMDYEQKQKEVIKIGLECYILKQVKEYSVWVDQEVYCLFGDKYGDKQTLKELCNDWKVVPISVDGEKQMLTFTMRTKSEIIAEVKGFRASDSEQFAEYLLNFLSLK